MPGLNKRSVINMNGMQFGRDYPIINFLKFAYYNFAAAPDLSLIDANGYSTNTSNGTNYFTLDLPSTANTPGPYILKWTGEGTVWLNDFVATWTEQPGSINYTRVSNGHYSGTNAYIIVTNSAFAGGTLDIQIHTINNANPITDIKFYLQADEADLTAGKVFRQGWKQTILDLNPGAIRCLNWTGGSSNPVVRWSDRLPPTYIQYNNSFRTPPYPQSTGTQDQVVDPGGTTPGMPVAMRHGEIAQFRIGSTATTLGLANITGISKNANGRVTTAAAHGFTTGMKIVHTVNYGMTGSMWQMHYKVATITVVDTTHYDLNINTSSFATFNVVSGFDTAEPALSLNVGARGTYPVFLMQSEQPATFWGNNWQANSLAYCVFDKYLVGDQAIGPGVWRTPQVTADPGSFTVFNPGCPVEVCTALVNELNAMKQVAHPGSGAINLWLTIPYAGLLSVDPDYDANEHFAVKTIDRCLNGDGGSWAGLTAAAALLVEFSNETWNNAAGFDAATYLGRIGQLRYFGTAGAFPVSAGHFADFDTFPTVRAMAMHQDIATAYPTQLASGRLIRVMGGQAGFGPPTGGSSRNDIRINGSAETLADPWNSGATAPYTKFETFCWAPYFDVAVSRYTTDLPTHTANWLAAVGAPAKEAVCASWVALVDQLGSDYGRIYETTVMLPQTAAWMVARGKTAIEYEGGYNWQTKAYGIVTTDQASFLTAVQNSAAWAASQKACFNAFPGTTGAYHPAIYTQTTDNRWGYNRPNHNNWVDGGSVEGAALNLTWTAMGEYNNAQDTGGGGGSTVTAVPLMLTMRLRLHA